eukprot:175835-Amorphochlora_amoeboformis.AAC.1
MTKKGPMPKTLRGFQRFSASLFGMKFDPNEVIRTEKIYLDRLHHLLDNYYHPIRASLGQRKEVEHSP